jgi:hypothetical protein
MVKNGNVMGYFYNINVFLKFDGRGTARYFAALRCANARAPNFTTVYPQSAAIRDP